MDVRTPKTCWAVNKCQLKYWRNCCIWLVIYLNCMMMHKLANFKLDKSTFQIILVNIPFSLWGKTRANLTLQYAICSLGQQNLHSFGIGKFQCSGMWCCHCTNGPWWFAGLCYLYLWGLSLTAWHLKMKALESFEMLQTRPTMRHIPEDQNPQLCCHKNLKSCTVQTGSTWFRYNGQIKLYPLQQ